MPAAPDPKQAAKDNLLAARAARDEQIRSATERANRQFWAGVSETLRARDLTQKEVAEVLGYSRETIRTNTATYRDTNRPADTG
ncbi:hypothetical protein [Streptomyces albidoflavus]|uniref:hypothetical protein n=1 Tax=Streptomyces albidoflavus TaxID=1886 RepID=UPI00101EFAE0|nr:hypothetical protein [Streptomyces albidoflavus]RZF02869.1 hypothetical protein C0R05_32155 [Streptomyces albidoflavus]